MLQEIASLYSSSWLDLFALNPSLKSPDVAIPPDYLVNVGHLYSVVPGDTLHKIAGRFGSSVDHLLSLNADIHQVDSIQVKLPPAWRRSDK